MKLTLLLLLVLFNYSFPPSFATLTNNSDSAGNPLETLRDKEKNESNSSISGNGTVSESKFSHAGGRGGGGGNGGHSVGEGNNGNSGQANASPRGAGGAVIPVYAAGAAGAAGQRNNNHNASNISIMYGKDGLLLIVLTTIFTLLLLQICM